jgi:hypothetical protein
LFSVICGIVVPVLVVEVVDVVDVVDVVLVVLVVLFGWTDARGVNASETL